MKLLGKILSLFCTEIRYFDFEQIKEFYHGNKDSIKDFSIGLLYDKEVWEDFVVDGKEVKEIDWLETGVRIAGILYTDKDYPIIWIKTDRGEEFTFACYIKRWSFSEDDTFYFSKHSENVFCIINSFTKSKFFKSYDLDKFLFSVEKEIKKKYNKKMGG